MQVTLQDWHTYSRPIHLGGIVTQHWICGGFGKDSYGTAQTGSISSKLGLQY